MSSALVIARHFLITLPTLWTYMSLNNELRVRPYTEVTEIDYTMDPVVILIHGRGGHPNDFLPLIPLLSQPYYAPFLGDTHYTSIEEDASKISQFLKTCPPCRYVLVGLSKGGNVAMKISEKDERIKKVITIASPLKGTQLAPWLFWSHLLQEDFVYNETKEYVGYGEKYHVVPKWDHLVVPTSAARLDSTPESNVYYFRGNICHQGIIHDPSVQHVVKMWISE